MQSSWNKSSIPDVFFDIIKWLNDGPVDLAKELIDGIAYPAISQFTYEGLVNAIEENQFPEYLEIYKTSRRHFEDGLIHCITVEEEEMGPSYIWVTTNQMREWR